MIKTTGHEQVDQGNRQLREKKNAEGLEFAR